MTTANTNKVLPHLRNVRLGQQGERLAKSVLRAHFTNVRSLNDAKHNAPFDFTGIDRVTGLRVAIEVKTIRKGTGKLVHIEAPAMERKLAFIRETKRDVGIVLLIVKNGTTEFFLAPLRNHISSGNLVQLK